MVTTFGIPSFVVTLAGLLGWQGALLLVLGDTGTINLPADTVITDLAGTFYDLIVGWVIGVGVVAAYLRRVSTSAAWHPVGAGERPHGRARDPDGADRRRGVRRRRRPQRGPRDPPGAADPRRLLRHLRLHHQAHDLRPPHLRRRGNASCASTRGIRVTRVKVAVFAIASTMAAAGGSSPPHGCWR